MKRFFLLTSVIASLFSLPGMADDECDYLGRHYRQDIIPLNEGYSRTVGGQILLNEFAVVLTNSTAYPGYKEATFYVKSVGGQPIFEGTKNLRVRIQGLTLDAVLNSTRDPSAGPLGPTTGVGPDVGQRSRVVMTLPASMNLQACQKVVIDVDYLRDFQWGCNVFANDRKELFVHANGARAIGCGSGLPVPPRPNPFPVPTRFPRP